MPSLRDATTRTAIIQRMEQLTPATKAKWGQFSSGRMLCHLNDALAMSLGEIPSRSMNRKVFQRFPLKHLALYVVPFPKGAAAPPEMLASAPQDFDADRERLVQRIASIAAMQSVAGPEHPLFGPLSYDEWNALHWKHIDHHLKQFGC